MSLNSAVIVIVPTGTADTGTTVMELFDAEAVGTIQLSPGLLVDDQATSLTDVPTGGMWLKAHWDQIASLSPVDDVEILTRRTMPGIFLNMSTPTIVRGRPMNPKYWGKSDSTATLRQDVAHLFPVADPDPVWDSVHSVFVYPPPTGGIGTYRWTVNSMPDPASFPGGSYPVGYSSTADNTTSNNSNTFSWAADSSTPAGAPWHAVYPYKPVMQPYTHYNRDGTTYTAPRALQFNAHYVQHMWADIGVHAQPFTWVVVAIILEIPGQNYLHHILDAGKDPRTYVATPTEDTVSIDTAISASEGLNYRSYLSVNSARNYMTNVSGRTISTTFHAAPTPRMFYGVWNGGTSRVGNYSPTEKKFFKGTISTVTRDHRYYVLGREQGWLGVNHASHMVLFEMRFWNRALTGIELNAQYAQLSSTWKFSQYK